MLRHLCITLIICLGFLVATSSPAKILIVHTVASYSHRVQTWPLAEALTTRGHDVHYISPYLPKSPNPNISELTPPKFADYVDEFLNTEFDINLRVQNNMDPLTEEAFPLAYGSCESLLTSPEFRTWLNISEYAKEKFDLVIVDNCFAECGVGLAYKLGAKYMIFSTVAVVAFEYDTFGFLPMSSAVPELEINPPPGPQLSFMERITNTFMSLRWRWAQYKYMEKLDDLMKQEWNIPNMPPIDDLMRNVSLIFYTGDVVTDYPRSLPPLYVNIAGIHCKESDNPLPHDIEAFISQNKTGETNDGFVYISLGSVVVSSNLPDHIKKVFFETIKAFPNIKFLWKWNGDFPTDIPKNLFLGKWFPQVDILGHPKIKGFVTQSGRPSSLEGLFNGVPMISFPILGDQDVNANRMSMTGASIKLEIGTVTEEEFKEAMSKILYDTSFRTNVKKLQKILRDRPMNPTDTAVWWTEYVLRNPDTSHLRPPGNDQYWFVRRQVDVWATLSITAFIALVGIITMAIKIFRQFNLAFGGKLKQV